MKYILTFKDSQLSVDRFPGFVSTEATPRHVHEDDDVALLAGQVGQPVHPPPAGHLLAAWPGVSETSWSQERFAIGFSQCKIDSYLDIA